jgi:hypothetical protein
MRNALVVAIINLATSKYVFCEPTSLFLMTHVRLSSSSSPELHLRQKPVISSQERQFRGHIGGKHTYGLVPDRVPPPLQAAQPVISALVMQFVMAG